MAHGFGKQNDVVAQNSSVILKHFPIVRLVSGKLVGEMFFHFALAVGQGRRHRVDGCLRDKAALVVFLFKVNLPASGSNSAPFSVCRGKLAIALKVFFVKVQNDCFAHGYLCGDDCVRVRCACGV
ncbi:MAG: hypothetical protein LBS59_08205 [Puniceicoccales bacterium]|nr:hypothetical protein [Puniceicoccales bacterium]